jgi:transcriptional regulator with XRE-family HTH domain
MPTHELIRRRRVALNMTQLEVVTLLKRHLPGFTVPHLSKLERGLRSVKADEVPAFAKVLQCEITDLHDEKPR